jgi:hypothetical protein
LHRSFWTLCRQSLCLIPATAVFYWTFTDIYIYMKMHVLMFSSHHDFSLFCRVISSPNSLLFTSQFL